MRKPKKDGKSLNCIIDREIYEQLESYCNDVGQTKTLAIERILRQFFSEYFSGEEVNRNGGSAQ